MRLLFRTVISVSPRFIIYSTIPIHVLFLRCTDSFVSNYRHRKIVNSDVRTSFRLRSAYVREGYYFLERFEFYRITVRAHLRC